jgi:hypothetical protein
VKTTIFFGVPSLLEENYWAVALFLQDNQAGCLAQKGECYAHKQIV